MFAALVIEREPLHYRDVPAVLENWVQNFGGYAAFAALLYCLYVWQQRLLRQRAPDSEHVSSWQIIVFFGAMLGAAISYGILTYVRAAEIREAFSKTPVPVHYSPTSLVLQRRCLNIGGLCGLVAAGLPFLIGMARMRPRRILAIASLSFKEAVHSRVLYVFSLFVLIFLFGSWFIPHKPQDQIRTYVQVLFPAMGWSLLLAASIIASFSMPADIRNQTIHTVLTKPVERFEVFLGRFLGFTGLMTLVLVVMSGLSLLYVLRGINPEAEEQSLKAHQPLIGDLRFRNTPSESQGINVGREWTYRSYITVGQPGHEPAAVWSFADVPKKLGDRKTVQCEFSFDIYHTTKGEEDRGVACAFRFVSPNHDPIAYQAYLNGNRAKKLDAPELAEQYGIFEVPAFAVRNFVIQKIDVPGQLFRNVNSKQTGPLKVEVLCKTPTQFVGMARFDLYLRLDSPEGGSEQVAFAWNFMKGSMGIWFGLCLVIGIGAALSTYLSGVISLLVAVLLYLGGMCREFIHTVATGTNVGGGPLEGLYRLTTRKNVNTPLDKTGYVRFAESTDVVFRWMMRRLLDVLPDVDRFAFTDHVAEGFNVPVEHLAMSLLILTLYLLPWFVLGYYLLRWREIASTT